MAFPFTFLSLIGKNPLLSIQFSLDASKKKNKTIIRFAPPLISFQYACVDPNGKLLFVLKCEPIILYESKTYTPGYGSRNPIPFKSMSCSKLVHDSVNKFFKSKELSCVVKNKMQEQFWSRFIGSPKGITRNYSLLFSFDAWWKLSRKKKQVLERVPLQKHW